MYYYILPTDQDLQHHGILGMKWGVRRYQSYDTVPRKSGESGKEILVANKRIKYGSGDKAKKYRIKEQKHLLKSQKYLNKAYKESIRKGSSNYKNTDSYKKGYEEFKKAKTFKQKYSKLPVYDVTITSNKLEHKYQIGYDKLNKYKNKLNKTKLKHYNKYGEEVRTSVVDVA